MTLPDLSSLRCAVFSHDTFSSTFDRRITAKIKALQAAGAQVRLICVAGNDAFADNTGGTELVFFSTFDDANWLKKFEKKINSFFSSISPSRFKIFSSLKIAAQILRGTLYTTGNLLRKLIPTQQIYIAKYLRAGVRLADQFEPDLIICEDTPCLIAYSKYTKAPAPFILFDSHEFFPDQREFGPWNRAYLRGSLRSALRNVTRTLVVNEPMGSYLSQIYRAPIDFRVFPNYPLDFSSIGVSPSLPPLKQQFPGERLWLFHGGFAPDREVQKLVKAFIALSPPGIRLILLITSGYSVAKELLSAEHSAAVSLLEPVSSDELKNYCEGVERIFIPYSGLDVNNRLAYPNKLGDAIAWKVPVAVSDTMLFAARVVKETGIGDTINMSSQEKLVSDLQNLSKPMDRKNLDFSLAEKLFGFEPATTALDDFLRDLSQISYQE